MSLLLDARKKSQETQSAQSGDGSHAGLEPGLEPGLKSGLALSLEPSTTSVRPDSQRNAGQNLFNAKRPVEPIFSNNPRTGSINRNLLLALGGVVLLLAAGAGYVWYAAPATQPSHAVAVAPPAKPLLITPQTTAPVVAVPTPDPSVTTPSPRTSRPTTQATPKATTLAQARPRNATPQIKQQAEAIDPLLNDAYLAYRGGKFESAQKLYQQALNLDARNTDALLGLAAIAQHRGADNEAAHYYSRVLVLDPRNAVANAGMSALTTDDNRESRLKNLLNEQQNSSSLHFALGNHYAQQARWGEAQQSYSKAYKLEPGNAELAFNLAVSLDRLGQKNPAVENYQRALQLDQSHSAGFDHAQIEQRVQELTR